MPSTPSVLLALTSRFFRRERGPEASSDIGVDGRRRPRFRYPQERSRGLSRAFLARFLVNRVSRAKGPAMELAHPSWFIAGQIDRLVGGASHLRHTMAGSFDVR